VIHECQFGNIVFEVQADYVMDQRVKLTEELSQLTLFVVDCDKKDLFKTLDRALIIVNKIEGLI
jgi:hypothetical protein